MKLFGWHELNEAAFGLSAEERDSVLFVESDFLEDGELRISHQEHPGDEGKWYRTFSEAKAAQKKQLLSEISWRKEAIAKLAKTKRSEVQ